MNCKTLYHYSKRFSHVTLAEWDGANSTRKSMMTGIYWGTFSVQFPRRPIRKVIKLAKANDLIGLSLSP